MWTTLEHYFQAQKFACTEHEELVRPAKIPMQAALTGRGRKRSLRPHWDDASDDIMREAMEVENEVK